MKSSYDLTGMLYGETSASRVWLMSHAERSALLQVLRQAQPAGAIEVGTAGGGSLEQIRQHARLTVSIDILPEVKTQLAPVMPNVEFLTGDSKMLIPQALQLCAERQQPPGFALIDGDHTYDGVKKDFEMYRPLVRKGGLVAFHDICGHDLGVSEVDRYWSEIKNRYPHTEIIENPNQKWAGIGLLYV